MSTIKSLRRGATATSALLAAAALALGFAASPAHAATTPLTVTVIGAQTYGGAAQFAGTTSVGGVTVSGVTCTALTNASTISPSLNFGSYTIDALTCSGGTLSNANYSIGSYKGSSYTVYRAPLAVKADDKSRAYGAGNPALTYSVTGYQNGESSSVLLGAPAISTTATATSDVGGYPIAVTQGTLHAANYYFTFGAGTLTVAQASVTVSVVGAQVYGTAPAFAGTSSVKSITVSGVTCAQTTTAATIDAALPFGSYTIDGSTCSGGTLSSTNYTIAGYTGGSYTVYRAALTVTANDQSRNYGAANPTLTYSITGFQNGNDASVVGGAPAISTTATATSDVGGYPITAAQGTLHAANYYFVFVPGTLTVNQAPVTVNVIGAQNYGSAAAFAGSVPAKGVTVSAATCTALSNGSPITSALNFGSYTIDGTTCSGATLSSTNYTIAGYTGASYTVYRAPVTVTADNQARVYGAANPAFTYSLSGFKNGDTASVVSGTPAITTPATTSSGVGGYAINVAKGSLFATNYYFVFAPALLTINKAPLTVTADDQSRAYGVSNPALTYHLSGFVNGDSSSVVSGAPTLATGAVTSSDAGTYPITVDVSPLIATNYSFSGVPGTFTVTQAPTVITTTTVLSNPSATLTWGAANTPIVGVTVTFAIGNTTSPAICTSTTDATGKATCVPTLAQHLSILTNGYTASYAGSTNFTAVSKWEK